MIFKKMLQLTVKGVTKLAVCLILRTDRIYELQPQGYNDAKLFKAVSGPTTDT